MLFSRNLHTFFQKKIIKYKNENNKIHLFDNDLWVSCIEFLF